MTEEMRTADIAGRRDDRLETADRDRRANDEASAGEAEGARLPVERAEGPAEDADRRPALLPTSDSDRFRARWGDVQTHFVDSPRDAVQGADALVAELMQHLAETFARERDSLEQQWTRGEDVSTEDLRVALTRYRSFFARLLEA